MLWVNGVAEVKNISIAGMRMSARALKKLS